MKFRIPPFASCSPDTFAKIWPKYSEPSKIEIVKGEHDVERGGIKLASSERECKTENYSTQRCSVFRRPSTMKFRIPPFASCSPDTFAKIWPKYSEPSKIEIVKGEHDVERGGIKLASSERECKTENYSTQRCSVFRRPSTMKFRIPPFASCSPDTFAKIWPKYSEPSKIEIVKGEHDVERGGIKLASSERECKTENYSTQRCSVFRRPSTMKFRIPPFASCSPDTFAKIWPKFSERSKIEIVTGEHDVERGGTKYRLPRENPRQRTIRRRGAEFSKGLRRLNSGDTSFRFMFF